LIGLREGGGNFLGSTTRNVEKGRTGPAETRKKWGVVIGRGRKTLHPPGKSG